MVPELVLHVLPPSHPCMTATAALRLKGLEYERVEFAPGPHVEQMRAIYGEERHTVPGMPVYGEPVHGSRAIWRGWRNWCPSPRPTPAMRLTRQSAGGTGSCRTSAGGRLGRRTSAGGAGAPSVASARLTARAPISRTA